MKKKLLIKVVKGDEAKKPQLAEARYQLKGLAVTVYRNFMYLADVEAEQRGFKPNLDNVSFQQVFDAMTEAFFTGNKVMEIPLVNGDNDVFQLDISNIDSIEEFNEMVDEMKREAKRLSLNRLRLVTPPRKRSWKVMPISRPSCWRVRKVRVLRAPKRAIRKKRKTIWPVLNEKWRNKKKKSPFWQRGFTQHCKYLG